MGTTWSAALGFATRAYFQSHWFSNKPHQKWLIVQHVWKVSSIKIYLSCYKKHSNLIWNNSKCCQICIWHLSKSTTNKENAAFILSFYSQDKITSSANRNLFKINTDRTFIYTKLSFQRLLEKSIGQELPGCVCRKIQGEKQWQLISLLTAQFLHLPSKNLVPTAEVYLYPLLCLRAV